MFAFSTLLFAEAGKWKIAAPPSTMRARPSSYFGCGKGGIENQQVLPFIVEKLVVRTAQRRKNCAINQRNRTVELPFYAHFFPLSTSTLHHMRCSLYGAAQLRRRLSNPGRATFIYSVVN